MFDQFDPKLMKDPPKKVGESLLNKKYMGSKYTAPPPFATVAIGCRTASDDILQPFQPFVSVHFMNTH